MGFFMCYSGRDKVCALPTFNVSLYGEKDNIVPVPNGGIIQKPNGYFCLDL